MISIDIANTQNSPLRSTRVIFLEDSDLSTIIISTFLCSFYSFISLHNFLIGNFCHIILLMQNFWHGSAFYFSNVVTCVTWEDINEYFKWLIGPPRLLFSSFHISQYNHNFTQVFTLNLSFVASSYKNIVEDSRKYLEER